MFYAGIKRLDSLCEISASMLPEARKLSHIGMTCKPKRSTLSDANKRRSGKVFENVYRDLYNTYKAELSADGRKRQNPKWLEFQQIMDSTTISLFFNLVFKGEKMRCKLVSLLTNDMEMDESDIIGIYRKRWEIELMFK